MAKFWNKDILRGIGIVLVSAAISIASPFTVYARKGLSSTEMTIFAQNDILFYDPNGGINNRGFNPCDPDPTPGSDPSSLGSSGGGGGSVSGTVAAWIEKWHDLSVELSIQYGIPWEIVIAQSIQESSGSGGPGTSNIALTKNNYHGLGAKDNNGYNAYTYPSPEAGWKGYYDFMVGPRKVQAGLFQGSTITDPYAYLEAITPFYATSQYYNEVVDDLDRVVSYAKEHGWKTSAEVVEEHPEMIENAKKIRDNILEGGGGSSGGGGSGSTSESDDGYNDNCSSEINDVALRLAWPDRDHGTTPKDEYAEALIQVGFTEDFMPSDPAVAGGYSCDVFVATVMRISGADPDFACCGAENILDYLIRNSDKYEEIENTGNTSNLQAGDIRVSPKHVEMVVQLGGGTFKIAAASHPADDGSDPGRTADYYDNYYPNSSFRIFRKI